MFWWPTVLNDGPLEKTASGEEKGVAIAGHLQVKVKALIGRFMVDDGRRINYREMKQSAEYQELVKLTRNLRLVIPERLTREEKLAFFLNVYNLMTVHAIVEGGAPNSTVERIAMNTLAKYRIGAHKFSLYEIENGVLRANRASPFDPIVKKRPFRHGDPREGCVVEPMDERIHFALNCGARSCPPIKFFTSSNVEDALRGATAAFLETPDCAVVDSDGIRLSEVFKWYADDFKPSPTQWILAQSGLAATTTDKLRRALDRGAATGWLSYDWTTNYA